MGKALQQILCDKFDVLATSRSSNSTNSSNDIKIMDITKRSNVKETVNEFNPDIIINCASFTDVDGSESNKYLAHLVNVVGLQNLIYASGHDIYIVQISSDYVFSGDSGPYSEEDHTYPVNYYGKTKLEAENILRGSNKKYLIIRPNVVYGANLKCKANFLAWVYNNLINNKPIYVVNDQISNPTYVSNLVEVIFRCIILNTEGIYHYGSDDYLSRYEFAIAISRHFKLDNNLIRRIDTEELIKLIPSYIAKRPRHTGLKTVKIEDEIGLTTYSTDYNLDLLKHYLS